MRQHLNTLFVMTDGAYLAKDGETIAVRVEKQTKLRVPIHMLGGIACFGRVGASPASMAFCAERGVSLTFLSTHGRFRAAVVGFASGNVLLRREQYRWADDLTRSLDVASAIVAAKIANGRTVLLRAMRDNLDEVHRNDLHVAARSMARAGVLSASCTSLEQLRGLEGEAAAAYFGVFGRLVRSPMQEFEFQSRSRRPPTDPMNAMLSFLYSVLAHDARSACEAAGLDPAVGFLHRDRPGRPGLALDLMEEFRSMMADRIALSLVNRKQVRPQWFSSQHGGGVLMNEKARKVLLASYQERKKEQIRHPFLNEETTVGLLIHLQARLLARFIRGDHDAYPAFVWR